MKMMQSILFLRPDKDSPIDRMINLDLLATAYREEDGSTGLIVAGAQINMGMKFEDFLIEVEKLIAENHRISVESAAAWQHKRNKDLEAVIKSVMGSMHQ
jgi:hypothetical protein